MDDIRLDKYLWAVRVFKTRSDAADAIRTNKVTVNGSFAKPSREVKIGDLIAVRKRQVTYSYKVLGLVSSRQGARNVPAYCLDVTPQEELAKLDVPRETIFVFRDRGTGRPPRRSGASWIRSWTRYFTTTGRTSSRTRFPFPGGVSLLFGRSALPGGGPAFRLSLLSDLGFYFLFSGFCPQLYVSFYVTHPGVLRVYL